MKQFRLRFPRTGFVYKCRPQLAITFVRLWTAKTSIMAEIEKAALESSKSNSPMARLSVTAAIYKLISLMWEIGDKPLNPFRRLFFKMFFFRFMTRNLDRAFIAFGKIMDHSGRLLRWNQIPPGLRTDSGNGIQSDWARSFFDGHDPYRETWLSILGKRELEKERAIASYLEMERAKEGRDGNRK